MWVSPYATEWRKIYMERVRQIAETGIDGIYIDIPYWMTHFEGWENSWASFDDYTVAAFKQQTGLDAKHDVKMGDFSDPGFRKWVEFRIQTFTDFLDEIDQTAKAVNPEIKTIPEIYPGIEEEAVRVGADVYSLYPVVDAIAHEYEFGNGDHMASGRKPLDWFRYQVGMHSFRAFAQGKADVDSELLVGWRQKCRQARSDDESGYVGDHGGREFLGCAGTFDGGIERSADSEKRSSTGFSSMRRRSICRGGRLIRLAFTSLRRHEIYYAKDFIPSYRGILILLMQKHLEFQIVTPRTLADFHGRTLVLPDVRVLRDAEKTG